MSEDQHDDRPSRIPTAEQLDKIQRRYESLIDAVQVAFDFDRRDAIRWVDAFIAIKRRSEQ